MSDVEFDTDNQIKIAGPSIGIVRAENKMAEWLLRKGVVKNQSQAQLALLLIAAGAIVIGILGWVFLSPSSADPNATLPDPFAPQARP